MGVWFVEFGEDESQGLIRFVVEALSSFDVVCSDAAYEDVVYVVQCRIRRRYCMRRCCVRVRVRVDVGCVCVRMCRIGIGGYLVVSKRYRGVPHGRGSYGRPLWDVFVASWWDVLMSGTNT